MQISKFSSNSIWEKKACYSRAIKIGNTIEVAGTTADIETARKYPDDAYKQAQNIFQKISNYFSEFNYTLENVIQTRIYITNKKFINDILKIHSELFEEVLPISTLLIVDALVDESLIVEIEIKAYKEN